jgi:mannose-1-phosphate guanylyltransferase
MRADRYLVELAAHAPDIYSSACQAMEKIDLNGALIRPDPHNFAACPSNSIDYAVTERAQRVAIVPVSCGWSDVGSWDALAEIGSRDADGNSLAGHVIALDSSNNHI